MAFQVSALLSTTIKLGHVFLYSRFTRANLSLNALNNINAFTQSLVVKFLRLSRAPSDFIHAQRRLHRAAWYPNNNNIGQICENATRKRVTQKSSSCTMIFATSIFCQGSVAINDIGCQPQNGKKVSIPPVGIGQAPYKTTSFGGPKSTSLRQDSPGSMATLLLTP